MHIDQSDVFGFSNGGTTALQIVLRHPALVRKLIIASSMYKREGVAPAFREGFHHPDFGHMPDAYKQAFLAINPDPDALHIMFDQCVQRMLHFTDIPDASISSIHAPALILTGDKDVPMPEHAVEMYHRLPMPAWLFFPGGMARIWGS